MKVITSLALLLLLSLELSCRHTPPPMPSAPSASTAPISVPAGATLALKVAQAIDSSSSPPDQTFAAVVTRDINNGAGQTILPSGSPATLMLLKVQGASAKGKVFELRLASVTLNGDSYLVRNESKGAKSQQPAARLGTFLGGVPGPENLPSTPQSREGPRQLTVAGERIWVPQDSLLTFQVDRPLLLIGSR